MKLQSPILAHTKIFPAIKTMEETLPESDDFLRLLFFSKKSKSVYKIASFKISYIYLKNFYFLSKSLSSLTKSLIYSIIF